MNARVTGQMNPALTWMFGLFAHMMLAVLQSICDWTVHDRQGDAPSILLQQPSLSPPLCHSLTRRAPSRCHQVGQLGGRRRCGAVRAAVAPLTPTSVEGFTQIGEPVPDNISMSDVLKTLPKEVSPLGVSAHWTAPASKHLSSKLLGLAHQ